MNTIIYMYIQREICMCVYIYIYIYVLSFIILYIYIYILYIIYIYIYIYIPTKPVPMRFPLMGGPRNFGSNGRPALGQLKWLQRHYQGLYIYIYICIYIYIYIYNVHVFLYHICRSPETKQLYNRHTRELRITASKLNANAPGLGRGIRIRSQICYQNNNA